MKRWRVLVVDDNEDGAATFAQMLSAMGHEVQYLTHPQYVLRKVQEFRPQVVFLDIGLPLVNGYDLARLLRHEFSSAELKLIAATGYGAASDRKNSYSAGFDAHLTKPVEPQVVEQMLELLFDARLRY